MEATTAAEKFIQQLNDWSKQRAPFLFFTDFEFQKPQAYLLEDVGAQGIWYDFNGRTNRPVNKSNDRLQIKLNAAPSPFEEYKQKFDLVYNHLCHGDSYLTNLTVPTRLEPNCSLDEIWNASVARYKLKVKNEFIVFSPEPFVEINNGRIHSFPMKGTIDAAIENAADKILSDKKEMAEHVTIVDLIRNDLSVVAKNVVVENFRYIDYIKSDDRSLLQVSSKISGDILNHYIDNIGDLLQMLLPAGSISGAPKMKTVEIIRQAEGIDRGYYTGVCGLFDGERLDSGVMIRFVERIGTQLFYRSGGGITTQSNVEQEYQEVIDKIYVPVA